MSYIHLPFSTTTYIPTPTITTKITNLPNPHNHLLSPTTTYIPTLPHLINPTLNFLLPTPHGPTTTITTTAYFHPLLLTYSCPNPPTPTTTTITTTTYFQPQATSPTTTTCAQYHCHLQLKLAFYMKNAIELQKTLYLINWKVVEYEHIL